MKTLERRSARVVLPAEEGPEMPSKKTGGSIKVVDWPAVAGSVEHVMILVVKFEIEVRMVDDSAFV